MKESDNPLTRSIGSFCAALPYRSATIWLITKVIRFSQTFPIRSIYPPPPVPPKGRSNQMAASLNGVLPPYEMPQDAISDD